MFKDLRRFSMSAILAVHRLLGTLLCVVFLMWFLTGFVMMYHRFPRVYESDRVEHLESLGGSDSLPALEALLAQTGGARVRSLRMERYLGQTYFNIQTRDSLYVLPADSGLKLRNIAEGEPYLQSVVRTWCQAPIARVDTLTALEQWIPFGSMKADLPIYKYYFDDAEQHQLYQSSQTGRVIQFTTHSERVWAWLGAIPHWVYFTWLRQDAELWTQVVIWLSGAGCIMVISGLWVGLVRWRQRRKQQKTGITPYKKKWYRWHHVLGLVFGLFALTFVFSGMMSMMDIPAWISHSHLKGSPTRFMRAQAPQPSAYELDYRQVVQAYPEALLLEWSNFREHPYYVVTTADDTYYIDAKVNQPLPLNLTEEEMVGAVREFYRTDSTTMNQEVALKVELLDHFETHYRARSVIATEKLLPVWKVTADDTDHSVFYLNSQDASVRYVDTTSRLHYWAYTALHRMRIGYLNANTTLRKTVLWVLLIGGTAISASGIVLGVNWLRRLFRRKKNVNHRR